MRRFENKVAIVTGCGSAGGPGWGNGKAIAALLAREGGKVYGCDIDIALATETCEIVREQGGDCEVMAVDVSQPAEVESLIDSCLRRYGRLDALINNVGIACEGGPVDCSLENWNKDLSVNLTSMFLTCKYAIPIMESQGGGSIVNISSLSAIRSVIDVSPLAYDTTKAAILGFSRSVALRYAKKYIRSNVVMPGLIRTPLFEAYNKNRIEKFDAQCPMGHMGTAWDIAEAVLYLASDASKYVTGTEIVVDGGISAKFPMADSMIGEITR